VDTVNIKDFKTNGNIKYGTFDLVQCVYDEIVINDEYGLNKLKLDQSIKTILDIGGNLGMFSVYARELFPNARIISLEAIYDTYLLLAENTKNHNIETYNMALGDGSILYFNYCPDHSGANQLKKEKQFANQSNIEIPSKTLKNIFDNLKIESPYVIKMDIEGSEFFLYDDITCIDILKNCQYFTMEFHKLPECHIDKLLWDQWLIKTFNNHTIKGLGGNSLGAIYQITRN
jgi:FkbM family methyltransferase